MHIIYRKLSWEEYRISYSQIIGSITIAHARLSVPGTHASVVTRVGATLGLMPCIPESGRNIYWTRARGWTNTFNTSTLLALHQFERLYRVRCRQNNNRTTISSTQAKTLSHGSNRISSTGKSDFLEYGKGGNIIYTFELLWKAWGFAFALRR